MKAFLRVLFIQLVKAIFSFSWQNTPCVQELTFIPHARSMCVCVCVCVCLCVRVMPGRRVAPQGVTVAHCSCVRGSSSSIFPSGRLSH
jgi:hypothetical protein